jgi:hypothetical protein
VYWLSEAYPPKVRAELDKWVDLTERYNNKHITFEDLERLEYFATRYGHLDLVTNIHSECMNSDAELR